MYEFDGDPGIVLGLSESDELHEVMQLPAALNIVDLELGNCIT